MFPGPLPSGCRNWAGDERQRFLGSWPEWKERGERLREGVSLIRKLWESDEYFDWKGEYFDAEKVYLYTRPAGRIEIMSLRVESMQRESWVRWAIIS